MGLYHLLDEKLEKIEQRLKETVLMLKDKQRTDAKQVFFDNQEFVQVMNISKRTAQMWRDNGVIGHSQVGGKFYYRLSDILFLLSKTFKAPSDEK